MLIINIMLNSIIMILPHIYQLGSYGLYEWL